MEIKDATLFKIEFVFEWEIPGAYIKHGVSLAAPCKRGMIRKLLEGFESDLLGSCSQTWDIGCLQDSLLCALGQRVLHWS
jgi:hypothetical protein